MSVISDLTAEAGVSQHGEKPYKTNKNLQPTLYFNRSEQAHQTTLGSRNYYKAHLEIQKLRHSDPTGAGPS